jgi:hypothetical protein
MKLKVDFSLPKLVKFRVSLQLGLDVGARVDVRVRLRGRDPLRWKAALAPERARERELPEPEAVPPLPPGREPPRA